MIDEQSKRLNKTIDLLMGNKDRIGTVEFFINTLSNWCEPSFYNWCKETNDNYKQLSANYISHLLSGTDSIGEKHKCRDALVDYKKSVETYVSCVMDIKWLMDELYALRIVELCRTGL